MFWKTVKPLFTYKISHKEIKNFMTDGKALGDNLKISKTFNNSFRNRISTLCN